MNVTPELRAEAIVVDGILLHPETIPVVLHIVRPEMFNDTTRREMLRTTINAWLAGYIIDDVNGYEAVGRYLVDNGQWPGRVFGLDVVEGTHVDTADPVSAAHHLAATYKRRQMAAELVRAAEAIAAGSDPHVVLRRLEEMTV